METYWHCRKTTISQFFSSSLWLWWDLEAWLGMAWQASALKVALATLMECMWHTRCLGDWRVVKCDEKPLRNHIQFMQAEGYQQALETCEFCLLFWDWFLHIYIGYTVYIYIGYPKKATFWSSGDFVDCPKFQNKVLRHVGHFKQSKQGTDIFQLSWSWGQADMLLHSIYIFLLIKTANDMWIYDSSHDSYAFFWPLRNFITQENVQAFHPSSC